MEARWDSQTMGASLSVATFNFVTNNCTLRAFLKALFLDRVHEPWTPVTQRINLCISHSCNLVVLFTRSTVLVDAIKIVRHKSIDQYPVTEQRNANRISHREVRPVAAPVKLCQQRLVKEHS